MSHGQFTHTDLKQHVDRLSRIQYEDLKKAGKYLDSPTEENYPEDLRAAEPSFVRVEAVTAADEVKKGKLSKLRRKLGKPAVQQVVPLKKFEAVQRTPEEIYERQAEEMRSSLRRPEQLHPNVNTMNVLHEIAIEDAEAAGVQLIRPADPEGQFGSKEYKGDKIYFIPPSGHS